MPDPRRPRARPTRPIRPTRRRSMTDSLEVVLEERAAEDLGDAPRHDIVAAVEEMVAHPEYPCLGARSVFRRDAATLVVLDDLTDTTPGGSLDTLGATLAQYAHEVDAEGDLVSFVACFRGPVPGEERGFEALLWSALQHLHDNDDAPWADGVAADPENPHFAFSVAGTAFFVVGLHPNASRVARRAPLPTLVFNLHAHPLVAPVGATPSCRGSSTRWSATTGCRPRPGSTPVARCLPTGRRRSSPTRMPWPRRSSGEPGAHAVPPYRCGPVLPGLG